MAPPPTSDDAGLVARTPQGDNAQPLTISEISALLKRTVEDRFGFVRLKGELSGVKRAASGHFYCALKDEGAVIDGVMWKGNAQRLNFRAEDGLEVIATGKLTTYPGRSKYQIVIDSLELAGEGALLALLEKTRARLSAEGLFDASRKHALPFLPRVIGVVTSPTGAVIRDILHRLRDRFPRHVLIWPVAVQGQACAGEVAAAIRGFNALEPGGPIPRPDLLIVARGGGSLEDLWGFNEEIVVRAAAASRIPLISAVGHETDTTLIDYAADLRAPTPTAAAELAVPVRLELLAGLDALGARQSRAVAQGANVRGQRLRDLGLVGLQLGICIHKPGPQSARQLTPYRGLATSWQAHQSNHIRRHRVQRFTFSASQSDPTPPWASRRSAIRNDGCCAHCYGTTHPALGCHPAMAPSAV